VPPAGVVSVCGPVTVNCRKAERSLKCPERSTAIAITVTLPPDG
jgi:hypothetical protein